MIVNINPGCAFGGSATEYFVGSFDGKEFVPETAPEDPPIGWTSGRTTMRWLPSTTQVPAPSGIPLG